MPKERYDVFISFRFGEALREAVNISVNLEASDAANLLRLQRDARQQIMLTKMISEVERGRALLAGRPRTRTPKITKRSCACSDPLAFARPWPRPLLSVRALPGARRRRHRPRCGRRSQCRHVAITNRQYC